MSDYVLDASAVIAAIQNEPGVDHVRALIDRAAISAVNLAEVIAKLQDQGVEDALIDLVMAELDLAVVPFDAPQAVIAGKLRRATKAQGLSLGDRACLAAAQTTGAIAVTADRAWVEIDTGVSVELIR